MKSITIKGSERESVGKKATKAIRDAGMVPCVIYGGDQPVHFTAEEIAFKNLVYTPNAHTVVIELENGKKFNAVKIAHYTGGAALSSSNFKFIA